MEVERYFGVRFPADYRRFAVEPGAMDEVMPPAGDFLQISAIERVIEYHEAGECSERFPGSVTIGGNGSREMLVYDFRQDPPPLVLLDITAEDWSAALYQAPSLSALLEGLPLHGWSWEAVDYRSQ